jgi:murein DD-endopeptidase MepM/ murein hydrolase activator NlpD
MTLIAWPLERNTIRREVRNNAFGMVRNGGTRAHQGWDLVATPLTSCYAVADGRITNLGLSSPTYGKWIELQFDHASLGTLYAVYCHLSASFVEKGQAVSRGDQIGLTGNTGNAESMSGEDQHLHFEIRTVTNMVPSGLAGRIDPAQLYGAVPVGWTFFDGHGSKVSTAGAMGLKIPGANVREGIK